jgi:hypothetical protein
MKKNITFGAMTAAMAVMAGALIASAATMTTVTPTDLHGWSTADTRTGGAVNYIADITSPFGDAALQLTTDATNEAKAQYMHLANTPLADVTELGYSTKQVAGPAHADASYQLVVWLTGTGGYTTFVYEPYQQTGSITSGAWQAWDVDAGQFWSSRSVTDGTCSVTAGAGGAPFYTLASIKAMCPNAVVIGYGVNAGTYNPGYNVYADGVNFNGNTYDFELVAADTTAPIAPTPLSPANGAVMTSVALTTIDWTDVTDPSSPVTYVYESSLSSVTNPDGSFAAPAYVSGTLATSQIGAAGTPEGTYYWHAKAVDAAGNSSAWSTTWSVIVDNTPVVDPPTPTGPVTKDDCKNDGWKTFTNPSFKNQGQCVSSVAKEQNQ